MLGAKSKKAPVAELAVKLEPLEQQARAMQETQ